MTKDKVENPSGQSFSWDWVSLHNSSGGSFHSSQALSSWHLQWHSSAHVGVAVAAPLTGTDRMSSCPKFPEGITIPIFCPALHRTPFPPHQHGTWSQPHVTRACQPTHTNTSAVTHTDCMSLREKGPFLKTALKPFQQQSFRPKTTRAKYLCQSHLQMYQH